MNWDWLKNLFPNLKNVNLQLLSNLHISFFSNNKKITIDKRSIKIDWKELSVKEKKIVLKKVPQLLKKGADIFDEEFKETAEDYKEKIGVKENQELLEYFRDKIPFSDLPILKASLYLRSVLQNKGQTWIIKEDIMRRYGLRGKNISNLCSAGYFEKWIRPAYEEMIKLPNFSLEKFLKVYEEMVMSYPFALFVHRRMTDQEIEKLIRSKIKLMKQYGITELNIHGIGADNVKKIREVIEKLQLEEKFIKSVGEEGNIIVVKMTLS